MEWGAVTKLLPLWEQHCAEQPTTSGGAAAVAAQPRQKKARSSAAAAAGAATSRCDDNVALIFARPSRIEITITSATTSPHAGAAAAKGKGVEAALATPLRASIAWSAEREQYALATEASSVSLALIAPLLNELVLRRPIAGRILALRTVVVRLGPALVAAQWWLNDAEDATRTAILPRSLSAFTVASWLPTEALHYAALVRCTGAGEVVVELQPSAGAAAYDATGFAQVVVKVLGTGCTAEAEGRAVRLARADMLPAALSALARFAQQ